LLVLPLEISDPRPQIDHIENFRFSGETLWAAAATDRYDMKPEGQPDAETVAAVEHLPWLRSLARRLALDGEDADDLVQETWLQTAGSTARPADPRGWLGGVLRNRRRMQYRASQRRRAREERAQWGSEAPKEQTQPDAALHARDVAQALADALAELDPAARRLLLHRYGDDRSAAELAEELGIPASTVRTRVQRALQQLRQGVVDRVGGDARSWSATLGVSLPKLSKGSIAAASSGGLMTGAGLKIAAVVGAVSVAIVAGVAVQAQTPTEAPPPVAQALTETTPDSTPPSPAATTDPDEAKRRWEALRAAIEDARARKHATPEPAPEPKFEVPEANEMRAEMDEVMAESGLPPGLIELVLPLVDQIGEGLLECVADIPASSTGELHFDLELSGEPEVGGIIESVEVRGASDVPPDLTACAEAVIYAVEFPAPEESLLRTMVLSLDLDDRTMQLGWPMQGETFGEFLDRYPELMEEFPPEAFADILATEEGEQSVRDSIAHDPTLLERFPALAEALEMKGKP
jgi:RNA polymerase sigma-70 factor (ECF subfamily)